MDKKLEVEFYLVWGLVLIFIQLFIYLLHDSECNSWGFVLLGVLEGLHKMH